MPSVKDLNQPGLGHIAIALADPARLIQLFRSILNQEGRLETIADQSVEVRMFHTSTGDIELIRPLADDTPVGRFIGKRGGGLHHIALRVPSIKAALEKCELMGIRAINPQPTSGVGGEQIVFLDPRTTDGVLIELIQSPME